jgi:hypothetical protein
MSTGGSSEESPSKCIGYPKILLKSHMYKIDTIRNPYISIIG